MSNPAGPSLSRGAIAAPLLSGTSLSKAFGGVQALDDVDVAFYAGEIHVLAGENGSGKSTLLRILSGALNPDSGHLQMDGDEIQFNDVRSAMKVGVTRISQELSLAPDLSVAENIFMGHGRRAINRIDRRGWETQSLLILDTLGTSIDPRRRVETLRPDQRQLVEIARALSFSSRLLCLDEPTSSLDVHESEFLFEVMRNLANSGVAVVFISHRLPEMLLTGDRFTVLRDGRLAGTGKRGEVDHDWLITKMVGREISFRRAPARTHQADAVALLEVEGILDAAHQLRSASFKVNPGEVVGLAGLVGAGKTELLELIAGVSPRESGTVLVDGVAVDSGIRASLDKGIGFVPEDRKSQGIVPEMGVGDNIMIGPRSSLVPVDWRSERMAMRHWFDALKIKGTPSMPINALSGGNQQKAVLARVLHRAPRVLLLDEPTRGVDIGAKAEIYEIIAELASQGMSIILASSELPEILAVSTRVLVMHSGMVAADLPFEGLTEEKIIALATGMM